MKTGRTIVVTGASGGIGAPIVDRFLANGDRVLGVAKGRDALDRFAADRKDAQGLQTVDADLTSEADHRRIAEAARGMGGGVDVIVNIAGAYPTQTFDETSPEDFRRVVDVNLVSVFAVIKALYPLMKGRGWGRIVNISSAAIYEGEANQLHYVAAKAGVVGLTRSLARAFGDDGVTVNAVSPGLTVTEHVRDAFPKDVLDLVVQRRCLQREETPDDLVGAVFFLASPDAAFLTGQTLNVDGGTIML